MRKNEIYKKVIDFKRRYPTTIAWRLRAHSKLAEELINNDEEVLYAFAAQKAPNSFNILSTFVFVLTDKRIVLAQKRLFYGYFYYSITPDMFNDLTLRMGMIWGKAVIDTVKEQVYLTNLSSGALREIETVLSKYMIQKKRELEMGDSKDKKKVKNMEKELKEIAKNGEK
ncbi:MAG: PH domain-containing protein [Bacilli bacterium]|nr:PH domain-containing protein [Bacilli bacterium]